MRQSGLIQTVFALLFAFILAVGAAFSQSPMLLEVDPDPIIVESGGKEIARFDLEIAETDAQRSAGLMFRTDFPTDRAMIFVFPDESMRFFWMRNTPTPLDIIYARANGEIVFIAENTVPFSETPIPSRSPAKYALEINAGLSKVLNIKPGDRLRHPLIGKQ